MQKKINPRYSIIIPNYNGAVFIEPCLTSVIKSRYDSFEVLVCDDRSTDQSFEYIKKLAKLDRRIKYTKNSKNLGAAATRNIAINKSAGEIIVFLDNDTVVAKNWLMEIDKSFARNPQASAVQCCVLDYERRDLIQHKGGLLMKQTGWLLPFGQWQKYKGASTENKIVAVSCALAIKKVAFVKVLGFDEKEAVHSEDVDLSWRMWIAGLPIYSSKKAIVYHWHKSLVQRSAMQANLTSIYFHLNKNSVRSMLKNYEPLNILVYLPCCLIILLGRAMLLLLKGNYSAVVGFGRSLVWNIDNISDTLRARQQVQTNRVLSDRELFAKVFAKDSLLTIYNKFFV